VGVLATFQTQFREGGVRQITDFAMKGFVARVLHVSFTTALMKTGASAVYDLIYGDKPSPPAPPPKVAPVGAVPLDIKDGSAMALRDDKRRAPVTEKKSPPIENGKSKPAIDDNQQQPPMGDKSKQPPMREPPKGGDKAPIREEKK
jgi:hypothetical protein